MQQHPSAILRQFWGFEGFRGSQEKIISAILQNQDVLALLPTGGGKSLCYQVPAMVNEGICIVVSPLVALIQDQIENLKKRDIKALSLTGGLSFEEFNNRLDNCIYGGYKFLYLSPERLQQTLVQERIQQMNVNLIAIDEAHCISQWGHDFRPAYLDCSVLRQLLPSTPIIALTATATQKVANDILGHLGLHNPLIAKDSFARNNIAFEVITSDDKRYQLQRKIEEHDQSVIVYVRTRRASLEISSFLMEKGHNATYFHGGLPQDEKKKRLQDWLEDKTPIMVATNAFGMGVDKPNVQLVVHYDIPSSVENYFQEAGRAGRNGEPASAVLLYNTNDEEVLKKQFITSLPKTKFIRFLYSKLNSYFQVAYGEGSGETFGLDLNTFCATYEIHPLLAYNGLRVLDQNSVVALSEAFRQKMTLRIIANKQQLFDYIATNKTIGTTIQTLLRTYGGLFDFDTKINTLLLSKKTGQSEKNIRNVLEKMHDDAIADYKSRNTDLEVTFLVPREDDKTINVFAEKIKQLNKTKVYNLEQMIVYIKNQSTCRSIWLLHYFGEDALQRCGICDICERGTTPNLTMKEIKMAILKDVKLKSKTSRELIHTMNLKESLVITAIQELLEDGLLILNHKNAYETRT